MQRSNSLLAAVLITLTVSGTLANAQNVNPKEKKVSDLRLGSTVIYVESGVQEVLDFYKAAFGLTIRYYDDNLKFGELETGGPSIMIASYAAGEYMVGEQFQRSANKRPADIELAFLMADVPAAYAKAVSAGAKPIREPRTMPWGQTVAFVSSVEGTLIGLLTPPPAPKSQ